MKRWTAMLLLLVCLCGMAGCARAETYTSGGYEYVLMDDEAEITRYKGKASAVTIPDTLNGKRVTSIGDKAFADCLSLTSVVIPNSVSSVGGNPFIGCYSLTDIRVAPNHPTLQVVNGVLYDKKEKRLISYPCSVFNVGYIIPEGTRSIGDWAFDSCFLPSVTIPASVTRFGHSAFAELYPPVLVVERGSEAEEYAMYKFARTAYVDEYDYVGENRYACGSFNYVPLDDGTVKIRRFCGYAQDLVIPGTLNGKRVSAIGASAFWGASGLRSVTIPEGVVSIGDTAFEFCTDLTRVTFPKSLVYIGESAFVNCEDLTGAVFHEGLASIGEGVFACCESLKSAVIPDSVEFIGKDVFWECNDLTITVGRGSYAEQYAKDNSIPYIYSVR